MRGDYFLQYVLGEPMMVSPSGFVKLKAILETGEIPKAMEGVKVANESVTYSQINDIAIISVDGGMYKKGFSANCMSIASYEAMILAIDKAETDPSVKTILFRVDTPGGFVAGADEVRERIYTSPKKTITLYENLGASGGMWIFTASDELYATPGTDLGSIGVVVAYEEQSEEDGKKTIELVSKNAKNKRCSINGDCKDRIQKKIDEKEEMFFRVLEENTGFNQKQLVEIFDEGGVIKAEDAQKANFIKEVIHFKPLMEKLTSSRVNSASTQIKNSNKGANMSDNTNTNEEVTALEASHAEALANLTATHEEAITSLREEMATSIATAVAESTKLHKEVIAMAFDRGVSKDVAMKMLDAEDITSAKATLVDNMSMDEKPTGSSTKAKADAWADFK
jgi:ClpP class serine protease